MALRSEDLSSIAPLAERYVRVRRSTMNLCRTLEPEDFVVQSMPSASPAKWHLAHTTWFFEHFILVRMDPGYIHFDEHFDYLFNSYYHTQGSMHARARRGLISRPGVAKIKAYREYVDDHMLQSIRSSDDASLVFLVELGLNHEQQHQELLLTDIKHAFSVNPIKPALIEVEPEPRAGALRAIAFQAFAGGIHEIGANGTAFCFDNETPRHEALLREFEIADRLVTNGEFRDFIDDEGYQQCALWLSDGWAWRESDNIQRPLYWSEDHGAEFTLAGMRDINGSAPVCHISYYEADAYARWAGARLPTEAEWEVAANLPVHGNFVDSGLLHPRPATDEPTEGLRQLFGDTWEWTQSSYSAYPGYQPYEGALGEYNGKFMCNQMVCRGGSCATPEDHIRATYRNFFYPHERWQFFGIRLARNS